MGQALIGWAGVVDDPLAGPAELPQRHPPDRTADARVGADQLHQPGAGEIHDRARCEGANAEIAPEGAGVVHVAEVARQNEGHDPAAAGLQHLVAASEAAHQEVDAIRGVGGRDVITGRHGTAAESQVLQLGSFLTGQLTGTFELLQERICYH